jgi:hypothetical protein
MRVHFGQSVNYKCFFLVQTIPWIHRFDCQDSETARQRAGDRHVHTTFMSTRLWRRSKVRKAMGNRVVKGCDGPLTIIRVDQVNAVYRAAAAAAADAASNACGSGAPDSDDPYTAGRHACVGGVGGVGWRVAGRAGQAGAGRQVWVGRGDDADQLRRQPPPPRAKVGKRHASLLHVASVGACRGS